MEKQKVNNWRRKEGRKEERKEGRKEGMTGEDGVKSINTIS